MKSPFIKSSIMILVCVFMLPSCASIVSKSTYPLSISTTPSNATVVITNKRGQDIYKGTTPAVVSLKSGSSFFARESYVVRISSPGYADRLIPVNCTLDGWYFGNLLFGGFIGMLIVDPATGAMYKLETQFINEKLAESTASAEPQLRILDFNEVPEEWKGYLVKVEE